MAYKIVIIDDEKEIREGFARFFPWAELGFEVEESFADVSAAFKYIEKKKVDLVISDVIMPEFTGIDLARMVSQMSESQKPLVVLFSAHEEFEYVRQALQYSCVDYILKTLEYDQLTAVFRKIKEKLDNLHIGKKDAAPQDKIVSTIYKYINENLMEANLKDAAELVYLSQSYLSRYFKQQTGQNFTAYLNGVRMKKAQELLLDLQYRIYDISEMLGYNSPFNFTRAFKNYFEISPKEYRFQKLGRLRQDDVEEVID